MFDVSIWDYCSSVIKLSLFLWKNWSVITFSSFMLIFKLVCKQLFQSLLTCANKYNPILQSNTGHRGSLKRPLAQRPKVSRPKGQKNLMFIRKGPYNNYPYTNYLSRNFAIYQGPLVAWDLVLHTMRARE